MSNIHTIATQMAEAHDWSNAQMVEILMDLIDTIDPDDDDVQAYFDEVVERQVIDE